MDRPGRVVSLIFTLILIPTLCFAAYKPVIDEDLDYYEASGAGSGDVTSVGDCTTGACFDGTQGTTLTFNNAGGDATIVYNGTTFTFNKFITANVTGALTGNASTATTATNVADADKGEITIASGVWSVENAAVIAKVITGFTSGAGALAGTDTLLQAINKLDGNIGTKQASDADLTTYAGITPTANAQTLLGETFAQMQASLSIDDLITLSGVAEGSVNLATFTGSTIADNVTIKAALQALETSLETKQAGDADLTTWAGITPGANVGTFLATPSSANLLAALTDETGSASGSPLAVFNQNPTINGLTGTGVYDLGGATSTEIVNGANPTCDVAGEIAINTTDKTLELNNGTAQVAFPTIHILQGSLGTGDYDTDPDVWLIDLNADTFPHGIYITKVSVDSNEADPTTELNADLKYCDAVGAGAFPGANAAVIQALDTTTGNMVNAAVNTAVATGKTLYITIDADPTSDTTIFHVRIHYYIPTA